MVAGERPEQLPMSIHATNFVRRHCGLSPNEKAVALVLADPWCEK
jgi:hypothetical protein